MKVTAKNKTFFLLHNMIYLSTYVATIHLRAEHTGVYNYVLLKSTVL